MNNSVAGTKRLLDEAQGWWPWSWAVEANQVKVRSAIEHATEVLDREIRKARESRRRSLSERASKSLADAEAEFRRSTARAQKTFADAQREMNPAKAREGALLAKAAIERHELLLRMTREALS